MMRFWMGLAAVMMAGWCDAGMLRLKHGDVVTGGAAAKSVAAGPVQQPTFDGRVCQLVQFFEAPNETDLRALELMGGEVVGVVPEYALLVLIDAADGDLPGTLPGVEWHGPCKPAYKLSAGLDLSGADVEVVVSLFRPGFLRQVERWVEQRQGTVWESGGSASRATLRATLPASAVEALSTLAEVEWIEPFVQPMLHNNVAVDAPRMNVRSVWDSHGLTGTGQVVAVADSGLDTGDLNTIHPDVAGRIRYATSWVNGDDWKDYYGHGTHVTGSVLGSGAAASNGLYRGVAYEAELVMQALGDESGSGSVYPPNPLGLMFEEAYTNGARIHQNSWGSDSAGAYSSFSREVDDFVWAHDEMLVVVSAGNAGVDADGDGVIDLQSIGSPGTAKNCLAVGAAESARPAGSGGYSSYSWAIWGDAYPAQPVRSDLISTADDGANQGMAGFSSRGPCADGRIKPDVVAPGTDIISCRSRVPGASSLWGRLSGENSEFYQFCGGTSMATPLVSGVAALTRQYFAEIHGVPNPSAALLKAAIINGAVSLYPGQYGTGEVLEIPDTVGNNVEGWGQVNAGNALFPEGRDVVFWDRNRLRTGEQHVFRLDVTETNGISMTLVWSDPPASLLSSRQLVNDLDLMLISPSGVTNRPNGLSGADRINNVEQIDLALAETGPWTMVVSGHSVPQGPQPYAVFASFSGSADVAFVVTSVWHEPNTVVGVDEAVELFAALTVGEKELAATAMVWREDGGAWNYEPLTLVGTNGANQVYSVPVVVSGAGVVVDYYAYAFSYDMELVMSPTNRFSVHSPVVYVAKDGSQTWPYDSLETAYTDPYEAVYDAFAGVEVRVAPGVYAIQPPALQDGLKLISLDGPEATVLDVSGQGRPAMLVLDASVSGFTVQGGQSSSFDLGGGVTVDGGVFSNCWVRGNESTYYGGGVFLHNGLVTHCRIEDNSCGLYGAGILLRGGTVQNSIVTGNESGSDAAGVEVWGGIIRNCTFFGNHAGGTGGGVDIGDVALVENCIVVSNTAEAGGDNWYEWVPMDMRYSCTAPLAPGTGNMDFDPLFADAPAGDFHLQSSAGRFTSTGWVSDGQDSPCIDFGNPLSDASCEPTAGRVNMGAYGNSAEASRSGTNETRLIVQSQPGTTDPAAGIYTFLPSDTVSVTLADDPLTTGTTQYQFAVWSLDNSFSRWSSTEASLNLAMTNNWIVRASHDLFYRVDLHAGENGSVAFSNGWYEAGRALTAPAVPDLYYAFGRWSGEVSSTNNPLKVFLTQPLELWAQFAPAYTATGVPQWWLGQYGVTNGFDAAALADPDGDGERTWEEYVAGTLPLDPNSVLKLRMALQPGVNALGWDAQADRTYTLYCGSNLVEGVTNILVQYYSIFPMSLELPDTVHADDPAVFYRLEVEYDGE